MPILAPLLFLFIASFLVFGLVGLITLALTWRKIAGYLNARRERDLISMRHYHLRLSLVISELLAKANEIDQQAKYLPSETESEWNKTYDKLGRALVLMGDTLIIIKERIDEKNVKGSREVTLLLCREAVWVSKRLLVFESRMITTEKEQLEKIKAVQDLVRESSIANASEKSADTSNRSTTVDGGASSNLPRITMDSSSNLSDREEER